MKKLLLICAVVALVGCGKKPLITNPILEKEIRRELKKPEGRLTEADLEKVTMLILLSGPTMSTTFNQLTSVKGLEKLTQLKQLNLEHHQLTNVKGLENLTQLKTLQLGGNQLTSVKGLELLTQLTALHLGGNELTDVKGLEKLLQLTELNLGGNQLTSVEGLEKLAQLTVLFLNNNPALTKAQIAQLQKALPKCEIRSNPTK